LATVHTLHIADKEDGQ